MLFCQSFGIFFVLRMLLNDSIKHSGLYSNITRIAYIGSLSGPHVYPLQPSPFAYLTYLMRNILLALLYSVFHIDVPSGFLHRRAYKNNSISLYNFSRFCEDSKFACGFLQPVGTRPQPSSFLSRAWDRPCECYMTRGFRFYIMEDHYNGDGEI